MNEGTQFVCQTTTAPTPDCGGHPTGLGDYLLIDFGHTQPFSRLRVDSRQNPSDYMVAFELSTSHDGETFDTPFYDGDGEALTDVSFTTQSARYLKIALTSGSPELNWWSVDEIDAYR
jgi:hypothetical protein